MVLLKHAFTFIMVIVFSVVLSGCKTTAASYPMYTDFKNKYLFTRGQKILILGFFGKNRKQFRSQEYSKVLESWLMKRPLYEDISTAEINREKLPNLEQIRYLSDLHKSKRILIFYNSPALVAYMYTFGKKVKHNRRFCLTSVPLLPKAHDMELVLGFLDLIIQPAAPILIENEDSATIVVPRNSAIEDVKTYAVLSRLYMEKPGLITYAQVVNRKTATVLDIQDWNKVVDLKKGYWIFPFVHSERMNMLKRRYAQKLKTANGKAFLGALGDSNATFSNDWLANTFHLSDGFVYRHRLLKSKEDARDRDHTVTAALERRRKDLERSLQRTTQMPNYPQTQF